VRCLGRLGVSYAQGLLFAEWLDVFGESRAKTASVGTLSTAVMEGSGVITGMLIARFGERKCCAVGGLLATCGLLLSSFATQLWHLHFAYSLPVGFGHSLSIFSGVVLMNRWFSSHKALASGIGRTGAGAGTLCFGLFMPGLMGLMPPTICCVRSQSVRDFVTEISGGATPAPVRCGSEL